MTTRAREKWPAQAERSEFYGDPRGTGGRVSLKWEAENLVRVPFPWRAVLAWDTRTVVASARVHRKCAASLGRVFEAIWRASRTVALDAGLSAQEVIEAWGMHLYGGGFEYRPVRGGTSLSSHSWGCAVDFDPIRNGYGDTTPNFADVPEVLRAFENEGWTWGGEWSKPDGMHWQAARVR